MECSGSKLRIRSETRENPPGTVFVLRSLRRPSKTYNAWEPTTTGRDSSPTLCPLPFPT